MSVMFEVFYKPPANPDRESKLTDLVTRFGGRLDCREEPEPGVSAGVCLTYEFDDWMQAEGAAESLRRLGEHIEGPMEYGA